MLRTHPSPADRLAVIEAQPKYSATPALTAAEWKALKSICGDQPMRRKKPETKPSADEKLPDKGKRAPPVEAPRPKRGPGETGRDI